MAIYFLFFNVVIIGLKYFRYLVISGFGNGLTVSPIYKEISTGYGVGGGGGSGKIKYLEPKPNEIKYLSEIVEK